MLLLSCALANELVNNLIEVLPKWDPRAALWLFSPISKTALMSAFHPKLPFGSTATARF